MSRQVSTETRTRGAAGIVGVALLAVVAGCAPRGSGPALPANLPTAERLLTELRVRREATTSLRGFAHVAYEGEAETVGSRHAILAERPNRFRLEVLSPFGALALVASDSRELVVYLRRENRIYRGPPTAASVAAYTTVPVPVPDVVAAFLGTVPERPLRGAATVSGDTARRQIRLTLPVEGGAQDVWFAPGTLRPRATALPLPDGRTLHVALDDYRRVTGGEFPYEIGMRVGERGLRVRYTAPSFDTAIRDTLFSFPRRDDLEEFPIEEYPTPNPDA